MKKIYLSPKMSVTEMTVNTVLVSSAQISEKEALFRASCKEEGSFQRCPFNNMWCYDKQKRFNAWRETVENCAKNNVYRFFYIDGQDRCPHGYLTLCHDYKQKQWG